MVTSEPSDFFPIAARLLGRQRRERCGHGAGQRTKRVAALEHTADRRPCRRTGSTERQRDRRFLALEHVEQREVGGGHRLEQPLLAEGPGAEALDVGHVRVQDERELAGLWTPERAHIRQTATKSSASCPESRIACHATAACGLVCVGTRSH